MAFSALINPIFGMVGTGLSAYFSYQQQQAAQDLAERQFAMQQEAMKNQMDMQMLAMGQASDQQRMIMEENNYRRNLEMANRSEARFERDWAKGEYGKYQNTLKQEREYMVDRQIQADKAAAQQRADALTEYMKNRDLAKGEREQAMAALKEAQAIAKGERDEDMKRLYGYQQKLAEERDYAVGQYDKMSQRLVGERETELERRRNIEGRIGGLQRALESTRSGLGDLPTLRKFTEEDIAAEEKRRADRNMADADRAADRVASINEANLIRSGIDSGTAGDKKRAAITEQIASLYDQARAAARDDALKYISGAQGILNLGFDKDINRRQYALGETGTVAGAGIDALMQMPGLPSAVNYNYTSLPSAAYDRSIVSANNYNAPMAINSAIYDNYNIPLGMANTLNLPSMAQTAYTGLPSAITGAAQLQFGNPQDYFNTAVNIGGDLMNAYNTNAQYYQGRADLAGYTTGQAFQNMLSGMGNLAKAGYDAWQTPSPAQSQNLAPYYAMGTPSPYYGGPK